MNRHGHYTSLVGYLAILLYDLQHGGTAFEATDSSAEFRVALGPTEWATVALAGVVDGAGIPVAVWEASWTLDKGYGVGASPIEALENLQHHYEEELKNG